jgi:acylphosphatase
VAAVRVVVHGDVQGVFFRDTCSRQAQSVGVVGWVRNGVEGTVEAVFDGEPEAVDQMVTWCRSGPPRASVERVDVSDEQETGLAAFEVRG